MDMSREIAAAVDWWADQLPRPKASLAVQAGCEDDTDGMAHPIATGMFAMLAAKEAQGVTGDRVEAFREALAPVIQCEVDKRLEYWADEALSHFNVVVATDYGPDRLLGEALEAAGFSGSVMTLLPLKTVMWVKPGRVEVSAGYGAPIVEVPLASRENLPDTKEDR